VSTLVDRLRDPAYLTPWLLRNETADAIEKLEAENSEWAAKSIERESHLAIANADNERLRAAICKACSEMGCYCKSDPPDGSCPMHQLEKALGSADAGSQGEHICGNTRCNVRHELCRV
jgi:hypothetical protein